MVTCAEAIEQKSNEQIKVMKKQTAFFRVLIPGIAYQQVKVTLYKFPI
jgi:hypothetical protein